MPELAEAVQDEAMMDALAEAQDLAFDAFDASSTGQAVSIAKKALKISPLCADAYGVLARAASNAPDKRIDLYERAVRAAEYSLGPDFTEEYAPHFWGFLETRPYMRARQGLAHALWEEGRVPEAIEHAQHMIELNPNDNQGIRYLLAGWLAEVADSAGLCALLEAYPDDESPFFTYAAALDAYRSKGKGAAARKAAKKAIESNAHVPGMLAGRTKPPKDMGYYSPGKPSEAAYVVDGLHFAWHSSPGAVDWLLEVTD